jgi:hypothetical protein
VSHHLRPSALVLALAWLSGAAAFAAASCVPGGSERVVAVYFAAPAGAAVAGLTLLLDYPETKVTLEGSGASIGPEAVTNVPAGSVSGSNDLDGALRQTIGKAGTLAPGLLFKVRFQSCRGAQPAGPRDFSCIVENAADPQANGVHGVTCFVQGG